jgi:hypothetical protein
MKKMILGVAALSLLTLASCKKDYTCECTTSVTGFDDISVSTTINETKKNAEEACEAGAATTSFSSVTCEIK